MELDDCVQTLGKADLLDNDLIEYVASLIIAEVCQPLRQQLKSISPQFFCCF